MIRTINGTTDPQPSFGVRASTVPIYTPQAKLAYSVPFQVVGLVPLVCPDADPRCPSFSKCDCREWTDDEYYINPVFASTTDTDLLKNDHSMFLLEYPFFYLYQWSNPSLSQFSLEEWDGTQWITTTNLDTNAYGTYYDFTSICIENWKGFNIDWRLVINAFGEGFYRFKAAYTVGGNSAYLVSEPYCLKEWSCEGTDVTVRWETEISGGRIGSITNDQQLFVFCCFTAVKGGATIVTPVSWWDQIRVYAFFGRETTEYEKVQVEYANGEIVQVRNEAIQKFQYESALQPKWIHDRLKAYGIMADKLWVTDYNWNNSDYEIDKRMVVCDGGYAPEYNENTRMSNVKVDFKEGFQNVIRDRCCDIPVRAPIT